MLKMKVLKLLRGKAQGKIEGLEKYGKLLKIYGWSTFNNPEIEISFNKRSSRTRVKTLAKISNRQDLGSIGVETFEFTTFLPLKECPLDQISVKLIPEVRFQKIANLKNVTNVEHKKVLSTFGLENLVKHRNAIDKINSSKLNLINEEKLLDAVRNKILQNGLEAQTLIILLKNTDEDELHSQLLLLELSHSENERFLAVILTESEFTSLYQFSWSYLIQKEIVLISSLKNANPSELSISLKKKFPRLKVLLVRKGETLTSLPSLIKTLESLQLSGENEALILGKKNSALDEFGSAICLLTEISNFSFPRAPIHDWDFIEFSKAINRPRIVEMEVFVGKQTFTFDSIRNEISKMTGDKI